MVFGDGTFQCELKGRFIGRSKRERSLIMSLRKVLGVDEILEILKHVRRIARRRWKAAVNVLGLVNVGSTLLTVLLTPIARSRLHINSHDRGYWNIRGLMLRQQQFYLHNLGRGYETDDTVIEYEYDD